jgi:cell division protease FtsH
MEHQWPSPTEINALGTSRTPAWVWLLLMGGFGLIFWQFVPRNEVQVLYYPWFIEQVESGNIKSLKVQGKELHGELRAHQRYVNPPNTTTILVRRFMTQAPSEESIQPIVQKLIQNDKKTKGRAEQTAEPTRIDVQPPDSFVGMVWIMVLLPTFLLLVFISLLMRKARVPAYGGTPRSFASAEEKVARAEAAVLEAAKLCRETVSLPDEQRQRLQRAISELEQVLKSTPQPEV